MIVIGVKDGIKKMIVTDDIKVLEWFAERMDTTEYVS